MNPDLCCTTAISSVQWRQAYVGNRSLAHLALLQVSLREARPLGRSGRFVLYLGSVGGRTVLTADRGAAVLGSLLALLAHQKFGEIRNGRPLRGFEFFFEEKIVPFFSP